ncbi:MAG: glycosyltransferase [Verrucomicrobia bacterium]|nr:glycosyltransferase [Verrucomicrobiota bacterium]
MTQVSTGSEPEPKPLVTVIIPTFNRARFLERSVRSVLDQSYRNIECLVLDGGSKDGSVEILARLAAEDSRLKYISEPDKGEVFATNRGLDMAKGEIVAFQASDDRYMPEAVATSVQFLLDHPTCIGVSGDSLFVDEHGNDLGRGMITYRGRMAKSTLKKVLILRFAMSPLNHQAFFGWRERLLKHGKFNPEFSLTTDLEFYLRLLAAGEEIGCIPRVQIQSTQHPEMGGQKHFAKAQAQRMHIYKIHGLTSVDQFLRISVGRIASYFANPYRTPLFSGLNREIKQWLSRS